MHSRRRTLDERLSRCTTPYSAGYQGSSTDARDAFSPTFERYGVQLVLSGHEHDYQRSKPIRGVTYIVSGAGGFCATLDRDIAELRSQFR